MKYFSALVLLLVVSNAEALIPPVKATNTEQLLYMLVMQNTLKSEIQTSYSALSNTPKTGKIEIYRKMKLCDLDDLYTHQKTFFNLNKAFYNNDASQFINEINDEQAKNRKIIGDDCKLLEKQFYSN